MANAKKTTVNAVDTTGIMDERTNDGTKDTNILQLSTSSPPKIIRLHMDLDAAYQDGCITVDLYSIYGKLQPHSYQWHNWMSHTRMTVRLEEPVI